MDIQALQAFVAVAEQKSFSLAGDELHLTQPAVSKRIASLEEQLNQKLFDRIGRNIKLTQAGSALLPRAKHLLADLKDTRRMLANLSGEIQGSLILATSHHIGLHRLPPLLKSFTQAYPQVKLDMRFQDSEQAYAGVLTGDLELAIVTLAPLPDPALVVVPVWQDQLRFVVAKDHPLSQQANLKLKDLTQHDAVLPGQQTFTRGIVSKVFKEQGLDLNVKLSTNYMETIKMMVSIGLGWSLLPETLIDKSLAGLKINHPPITRPLGFLYHRQRPLSNAARQMIQLLKVT